ncbi:MAG: addiction module protein [Microcystis sp. M54BS1]|mgnify:FL=1|jgi:putative addiction module component (TIGR02574 family)|uniref:Addiction module component n=3 Tax=Microcystis aeruginosa TaxID=1126 RepID=I4I063_MICAE|nr:MULTISPECIES: addiction module protein [Microcystis]MCA2540001.1 addiction module protein [Microcystis sp. M54BS1]MCA2597275.1 addiction module protein [Microcystis sp. M38BS1]MCA2610239.1 addiction module protein [Microcystis sp. M27BS1]MCZ8160113.1 addiction module protein [Microcystis sp. LE19-196.1B]MCZ8276396.1 addiction module protein [Microcystis sp. LE19-4.1E]MCZ8305271.1 addiction module protein [Microcystis sp. LE19-98.1E]MDJ0559515.1 addiction module protein [Microcystis sp. M5
MTKTAETLKIELAQLSVQDRAELAYFLIHSLDEGVDDNVLEAWDRELTQRLAEIYAGTAKGEPSDKVLLELREKYS